MSLTIEQLGRVLAPIKRRIMLASARGVVSAIDDTKPLQRLQAKFLADEVMDRFDRLQNYGFTSVPLTGSELLAVFLGGNRNHGVAVVVEDRRNRLKSLLSGDVAMFNAAGAKIVLRNETKNLEAFVGKLKIENDSDELIDILSDTLQAIINHQVFTAIGPQNMMPADVLAFQQLKTRLDTFKV